MLGRGYGECARYRDILEDLRKCILPHGMVRNILLAPGDAGDFGIVSRQRHTISIKPRATVVASFGL